MDPDLAEWDYGAYEGLTTAEIRSQRPGWELFADGAPEGETATEVGVRVDRVIERVRSRARGRGSAWPTPTSCGCWPSAGSASPGRRRVGWYSDRRRSASLAGSGSTR